jgi:hypothetical protein
MRHSILKQLRFTTAFWLFFILVFSSAIILGLIDHSGHYLQGWLAYFIILSIGTVSIYGVWKAVRAHRRITTAALVSFSLRLGVGIALVLLLPIFGYQDSPEHQAGYMYTDAYIRDNQAWTLASSGESLAGAFSGQFSGDQYGGLLALSALIYRLLSPDAHRPILILILNASISTIGVLCLWKAFLNWFGEKTTLLAAWIFALYPESVLLASSQMREAIVIPMIAVAFYGISEVQSGKSSGWWWMILSAVFLLPIQPLAGLIAFITLLGIWFFDPATLKTLGKRRTILAVTLSAGSVVFALLLVSSILVNLPSLQGNGPLNVYLTWFRNNFTYQSFQLERSSGIFQSLINSIGERWRWLIVGVYGIAQPVLPAVVGDPGAALIMRIIGFLRAAGWYALVLFLVYGAFRVLRNGQEPRRYQVAWMGLISWVWILVSAFNAGADQWDNPRYRAILLIWQALLAAWAWWWARSHHDPWLWRWLAVEGVFVGLFTEWYVGRYYPGILHLDIKWMSLLTLAICGLILVGGVIWDRYHKMKPSVQDSGL